MIEIKFRVWNGEKIESNPIFIGTATSVIGINQLPKMYESHNQILMQFTGLKDKNGKEIYEGDIVRLLNWEPQVYEVVFDRGAFCFRSNSEQDHNFYNDCKYLEESAVIGNIYENPEIITEQKNVK